MQVFEREITLLCKFLSKKLPYYANFWDRKKPSPTPLMRSMDEGL